MEFNTTKFSDYDSNDIYEFLFLQGETEFEITIPRNGLKGKCDSYYVFEEFLSAAYAGQRLSEIAESFAYYVPCVHNKCPFLFEVTITEMGKLAEALYIITHSINKKIPCETFLTFHSLAADFLTNVINDKAECNTLGLLWIANQYLQKS